MKPHSQRPGPNPGSNPNMLRFGKVTLDLDRRILLRAGRVQHLSQEYWNALIVLVERRPNTVSKDELRSVLGKSTDATLTKQIGLIRKALGDNAEPHKFIQSERGHGYRFIAVPDEMATEPEPPHSPTVGGSPEAQLTRWGPVDGKPAGICINSCDSGSFVPWSELKGEIEAKLLNQAGRVIPDRCTVTMDDFHGKRDWVVRIIDPEGQSIGYVWFGPDPDKKWTWDGLVRLGNAPTDYTAVVWQVYQRYSDGSYRRIAAYF